MLILDYCYGCGVCAAVCPQKIISICLDRNGFYKASVENGNKCIDCGLCLDVCAFRHKELALKDKNIKSWAAWSNNFEVRKKCSSGGVGFEIGKQLIEQGYKVVGCRYDTNQQRAEHYIANSTKELIQSIGSKYIQSYTEDAFKEIDKKQKYLIVGTPCQIDSIKRMIMKYHCENNFVLIDFYCHCVPSMLAWKSYIKMQEKKVGRINYASWRNKFDYGWHDSWLMSIDGDNTSKPIDWDEDYSVLIKEKKGSINSRKSQGDLFYKLFLGDVCMGPQCEKNCKYKYDQSSADIRIGDLWGKTYRNDEKGVSALVAFTEKGNEVIHSLHDVTLIEHPFEVVAEGQMKTNAKSAETAPIIMKLLQKDCPLEGWLFKFTFFLQKIISKFKSFIK